MLILKCTVSAQLIVIPADSQLSADFYHRVASLERAALQSFRAAAGAERSRTTRSHRRCRDARGRGNGLAGLTHRAVADEAGVPLGSTTYYFADRNDLLVAAMHVAIKAERR